MMQQLEIQYFFPLTEQIPLDLDFKPSEDYEDEKRAVRYWANNTIASGNYLLSNGDVGTTWATITNSHIGSPSFTINVDQMPITIVSKKKPNFIMKFIYKSMGMKWKSE